MTFENVPLIMVVVLSLFFFSSIIGDPFGSVNQRHYTLAQSVLNTSSRPSINMEHNLATYENSTFGIKINHPQDWNFNGKATSFFLQDLHKQNFTLIVEFSYFQEHKSSVPSFDESVYVRQNFPPVSLTQFTDQRIKQLSSLHHSGIGIVEFTDSNNTTLAGNPAHKIVYTFSREAGFPLSRMEVWTIIDHRIYMVTFTDYTGENPPFFSRLAQGIIDSFVTTK